MGRLDLINEIIDWHTELRRTRSGAEIVHAIEERIARESNAVKLRQLNILLGRQHEAQGNHAEAEEIYRRDPLREIDRWHHDLVWANKGRKITGMIEKRIEQESDPLRLRHLHSLLAMEHTSEGNYAAAEAIRLQEFGQDPDDPMPLISLAEQKLYDEDQLELAMSIIEKAIQVAYRSGIFRRHALAVKARIALQLGQYEVVEGVLRDIMELKFTPRNFDIGRERDILDRLPPESIDSEVARQYDEYCRARRNPPAAG